MYKMTLLLLTKQKKHPLQTILQSLGTVVLSETVLPCDLCIVFSHPTKEEINSLGKTPLIYYVESDPMTKDIDLFLQSEKATTIDYTCILLSELFFSYKSYLETRYPTVPIYDVNSVLPSYPAKLYDGTRPSTKTINIFVRSTNTSFTETVWRQLCIAEHIFLKTPELLNEVYLFNVPSNKCAVDMYENLEIFKNKKLRTFIDFEPHQIIQHFNLQPQRSVYLMNSVADVFDPLALYCLQNQIGVVHSSEFMKKHNLGKYYKSYEIETAASLVSTYLTESIDTQITIDFCKRFSNTQVMVDTIKSLSKPPYKTVTSTKYTPNDITLPLVIGYDNTLDKHPNTQYFIHSLKKNNWEYSLVSISEAWNGFTDKLKGYMSILETLPSSKVVILSDTRDVVCCRKSTHFMQGFQSKKAGLITSMEILCGGLPEADKNRGNCVPLKGYWNHHKRLITPLRKFVNSGLLCGTVTALKEFLSWSIKNGFTDDQVALGHYMNDFPSNIYADDMAELFHTSLFGQHGGALSPYVQKQDSPTFSELFGRGAFFLHLPQVTTEGQATVYKYVKAMLDIGAAESVLHKKDYPDMDFHGNFVNGAKIIIS
jgi:hypothetical protein